MRYKIDGQLVHCTSPEEMLMWLLLYANDISLACDTAETLSSPCMPQFCVGGLTTNTKKTKALYVAKVLQNSSRNFTHHAAWGSSRSGFPL